MAIDTTNYKNNNTEEQQMIDRYKFQMGQTDTLTGDSPLDNYLRQTKKLRDRKVAVVIEEDQLEKLIEDTIEDIIKELKM